MFAVRIASELSRTSARHDHGSARHETECPAGCATHIFHPYSEPGLEHSEWRDHVDRQTDIQTDIQTDRLTDGQKDRHTRFL